MYGYNGYNHYDPFSNIPFYMMMSNFFNRDKKNEDLKEEDVIRHFKRYKELFSEMKREFEPPKKEEPKKKDDEKAWTTNDYWTFIVCWLSIVLLGGGYFILHEIVEFARIIHEH